MGQLLHENQPRKLRNYWGDGAAIRQKILWLDGADLSRKQPGNFQKKLRRYPVKYRGFFAARWDCFAPKSIPENGRKKSKTLRDFGDGKTALR